MNKHITIIALPFSLALTTCAHSSTTTDGGCYAAGAWFCCQDSGDCALATTVCPHGSTLKWCKKTGTNDNGETICLDK